MELRELLVVSVRNRRMKKLRGLFRKVRGACRVDREYPECVHGDWSNLAHIHLDWKGYGDYSPEARKMFLAEYASRYRNCARYFKARGGRFQLWLMIHPHDSGADALYFHTENPHTDFPVVFPDFAWKKQRRHLFSDFLPELDMEEGHSEEGYAVAYYTPGIGLPLR